MSGVLTGRCLCGAVTFEAVDVARKAGICHCEMCRRWTGSSLVEVSVPEAQVTWAGETIRVYSSSDWGERAFCSRCGTGLYFRVTQAGEWAGNYDIPLGILDDPDGFDLSHEIFIDQKPDSYAFAGEGRVVLTRAECVAKFPTLGGDAS